MRNIKLQNFQKRQSVTYTTVRQVAPARKSLYLYSSEFPGLHCKHMEGYAKHRAPEFPEAAKCDLHNGDAGCTRKEIFWARDWAKELLEVVQNDPDWNETPNG